jgi:enoyl-CoA hydratase/carnithine racemase
MIDERMDASGVLRLTLNDPARKNALGVADYSELARAMRAAADDPACRVVLLQGAGGVYSAGNRLDEFDTVWPQPLDGPVVQFFHALVDLPMPVVARVEGPAVGVGATMLLHCDVVVMAREAFLKYPFLLLSIAPEGAATSELPARLGALRAFEILTSARRVAASEALALGLCTEVAEPDAIAGCVDDHLARLAALSPEATRRTKALLRPDPARTRARMTQEIDEINKLLLVARAG